MARILVAEDEHSLAELVEVTLTGDGHEVVLAEDGRYALKAMMDERFDLVVLDLMMPWSDGFDVLRNTGGAARPKVVVLTARDDDYSKRRATEWQVDAYLVKPYDPAALSATVNRLLGEPTT